MVAAGPGVIQAWDLEAPGLARSLRDGGYTHAVDFSPDGERLLSGSWDGAIRVRDATTGALLRELRVSRVGGARRRATG